MRVRVRVRVRDEGGITSKVMLPVWNGNRAPGAAWNVVIDKVFVSVGRRNLAMGR